MTTATLEHVRTNTLPDGSLDNGIHPVDVVPVPEWLLWEELASGVSE